MKMLIIIILLVLISQCTQKPSNVALGYAITIEEIETFEELCNLNNVNQYFMNESEFYEINKTDKFLKLNLTNLSNDNSYVQINKVGNSNTKINSYLENFGIFCPDTKYKEGCNHEFFYKGYDGDFYLNLKKGKTISTLSGVIRDNQTQKPILDGCVYFQKIVIFDKGKNRTAALIYDIKNKKLYPSLTEIYRHINLSPKPSKQYLEEDFTLLNKQVKREMESSHYKKWEINRDTFLFFIGEKHEINK